ncbi:MAG: autotransporter-associated beta strand repeat-containing protein, partial [Paludibacter sp.]
MKKITLLVAIFIAITSSFATTTRWFWYGDLSVGQTWDMGTTANWYDPTTVDPLIPFIVPDNFVSGTTAIFDEKAVEGSDTLKVNGVVNVDSILANNTRTYVLRSQTGYTTDSITGTGTFVKDDPGTFVMDCKNTITGGTIIKAGKLMMEKQTTPNIFGSKLVFQGGTANFATTTSSSYPMVTVPIEIPAGVTAKVELSRYSYWSSPITGSGDLHIYAGGERTYMGAIVTNADKTKTTVLVNWSAFTGNVIVDKYVMSGVNPGFYGLILPSNKTFKDSLGGMNIDSTFYNRKLTLGDGVQMGSESGTRAYAIGELKSTDSTSVLAGYYKKSTSPKIYYFIGGLNTDVVYPGRIAQNNGITTHYNHVGIIKVGTGTYTLTNSDNDIIGGVVVREGGLLVCDKILHGTVRGGVGNFVNVEKEGMLGGTGRIDGNVNIYGMLKPGANGVGTLLLSDSLSANPVSKYGTPVSYSFPYGSSTFSYKNGGSTKRNLNFYPGSSAEFEINSVT